MGLYIHIPFCVSKCGYCDFLSFEGKGTDLQEQYVNALLNEIKATSYAPCRGGNLPPVSFAQDTPIDTIYIGGGTPTALPSHLLCKILSEAQAFNLAKDPEITVEMNPCTTPHSILPELKAHGVNRLSIGLQAFQDNLLKTISRAHTAEDFINTFHSARAAGINNINVDLMFGLPGQTQAHWQESLSQLIALSPEHVSAYSLTPAEDTPLWDALEKGSTHLPSESADREMYHEAISTLSAAGYQHYELSNFAKPGHESRHNVSCWLRKPYLGLGLGAHSFDTAARWHNTMDMKKYLCMPDNISEIREDYQPILVKDAMAETMFLGLRLTDGVNPQDFFNQYGKQLTDCYGPELEMLISKGLLAYKPNIATPPIVGAVTCRPQPGTQCSNIALTPLGLDLANQVFEAFL